MNASASDLPTELHDKLKQQLEQVSQGNNDPGKYSVCTKAKKYNGDQASGRELLGKVKSDSSRIRSQLSGIVQSKKRVKNSTKSSGRRLRKGKLHRIAAGNTKVFQNKGERVSVNTAVHLSIDLSGSMQGNDEIVAREAAMALAIALEGINGVNPGVSYFAGYDGDVFDVLPHGERVAPNAAPFCSPRRWWNTYGISLVVCSQSATQNQRGAKNYPPGDRWFPHEPNCYRRSYCVMQKLQC